MEKSDHDLLIEINRDMTWIKEWSNSHSKEDSEFHAVATLKIDSAHKRIDWLMISGVLSVVILSITMWFKK